MNKINANKKRVLREMMNKFRADANQHAIKSVRGFNKIFGTDSNTSFRIMNDLVNTDRFDVQMEGEDKGLNMDYVKNLYFKNAGKEINFVYKVDDKIIVDTTENIPNFANYEDFVTWWNDRGIIWKWRINTDSDLFDDNNYNGKVYAINPKSLVNVERIKQSYLDGAQHCVFEPMRKWVNERLSNCDKTTSTHKKYDSFLKKINKYEMQYRLGVPEDKLEEICENLNIRIKINLLFDFNYETIYGSKLIKPMRDFTYVNSRNNHLDINSIDANKTIKVSQDQLYEIRDELDKNKILYYYTKGINNISAIYSNIGSYSVLSDFNECVHNLKEKYNLYDYELDDIADKEVSEFILSGTHYNGNMKIQDIDINELKCIDQKKAYYNFKKCKYYEGFLGKVIDFRKCDKVMGIGLYMICNIKPNKNSKLYELNQKLKIFQNNNIYTTAELKYLDDNGYKYRIYKGAYGFESFDFEFGEEMLEKFDKKPFVNADGDTVMRGKSYYSVLTGMFDSHNKTGHRYMHGTELDAQTLKMNTYNSVKYMGDGEIRISFEKKQNYHLGHITAFILAYQRLGLLAQLEEMDINKLAAIYVDGIYYKEHEFKLLDTFSYKDIESYSSLSFDNTPYISRLNSYSGIKKLSNKLLMITGGGESRELYKTELWTGAGGCGKTHFNLSDEGIVRPLYCAVSHKLNANKKEEFNIDVFTWAAITCNNPEFISKVKKYNTLIIDEVSMMSNEIKELILSRYGNMRIIFCGDIGYQLPAIEGSPFNDSGIEYKKHLNVNRRVEEGDPLLEILNDLRKCIDTNTYFASFIKNVERVSFDYVKENYKIEDMILSYTKSKCDKYTELFPDMKKWYIEKGNQFHNTGDILIQDEQPIGGKLKHAFTVHSIQGETAKGMLYIDKNVFQDIKLLYTALSRAKRLSQIKIVE